MAKVDAQGVLQWLCLYGMRNGSRQGQFALRRGLRTRRNSHRQLPHGWPNGRSADDLHVRLSSKGEASSHDRGLTSGASGFQEIFEHRPAFEHRARHHQVSGTEGAKVTVCIRVTNNGTTAQAGTLFGYWAQAPTGLGWPASWNNNVMAGVLSADFIGPGMVVTVTANSSVVKPLIWTLPNPANFASASVAPFRVSRPGRFSR